MCVCTIVAAAARLTRLKSGLKSAAVTGPLCVYSCVSRSSSAGSKIPINDVVNKNAYNRKIMNTSLGRQDNANIEMFQAEKQEREKRIPI